MCRTHIFWKNVTWWKGYSWIGYFWWKICKKKIQNSHSWNILFDYFVFWFFLSTSTTEDDLWELPPKCPVIGLQRGAMIRKVGPLKLLHFCGYLSKRSRKALLRTDACRSNIALISLGGCSTALRGRALQSTCSSDIIQNSTLVKVIFLLKLKNPGAGMRGRSWRLPGSWLLIQDILWMFIAIVRGQPDNR